MKKMKEERSTVSNAKIPSRLPIPGAGGLLLLPLGLFLFLLLEGMTMVVVREGRVNNKTDLSPMSEE